MTSPTSETAAAIRMADKARRYYELRELCAQAEAEKRALADELRAYIDESGEPLWVEGLPVLKVVERRGQRTYDVKSLAEQEPKEFQRLLDLGCLTVNNTIADAQQKQGNLSGMHRRFSWQGTTAALVFAE